MTIRPSLADILALRRGPAIWRGRTLEGEVTMPGCTVEGWVTVELIHARTGLVKRRLRFRNHIVDAGLDAIAGRTLTLGNYWISGWIGVGTGSTAPANSDVALVAATGVRTNSVGGGANSRGFGAANAYSYYITCREFTEAQSNGNLTEFGIFNLSAAGTMLVRQLFRDGLGAPTTIVKTSSDRLRILYEFRIYPPTVDGSGGPVSINSINYDWTSRAALIGTDTAWGAGTSDTTGLLIIMGTNNFGVTASNATALGSTTSNGPTGSTQSSSYSSFTTTAYSAGTFLTERVVIWEPGVGNFTSGVRGFTFQPWGSATSTTHQMLLSAHIPKVNTQRLTMTFRYSIARHTI